MAKKKGGKKERIVIGNWKMNPSSGREAENLFKIFLKNKIWKLRARVIVCPPALYLERLYNLSKKIPLGVQNIYYGAEGASTGEISAKMVENSGGSYVILGHSERKAMGEDGPLINKKIKTALYEGLVPVLCVGEKTRDQSLDHFQVIKAQIEEALLGITRSSVGKVIVAYEPVWAVGNKALREARAEEFREVSVFIRKVLSDRFGVESVRNTKVIYGGSVNPGNVLGFISGGGTDGFLVGGDSLNPKKFLEIVRIASDAVN